MNIWDEANKLVARHAATFEKFRAYVAPYFELRKQDASARVKALLEGVEFRQRPVIALRLYDKWDKIVIRPCWTGERKDGYQIGGNLNPQAMTLELFRDHPSCRGSRLDMRIAPDRVKAYRISAKMPVNEDNIKYVADTLTGFLDSPVEFFQRGDHSHCCFCGKELTDQVSVSRGVGPECIKVFDYFMKGTTHEKV